MVTSTMNSHAPSIVIWLKSKLTVLLYIKVVVFLDFLGVSLVVPLLSSYFKDAGVSSQMYSLISSLYAASQMVGGLVIGSLADILAPRDILVLSLLGSACAYSIVGLSTSLHLLFASRVIVGLVKQTFTVAISIISEHSTAETRARQIGHISAAATLAFIIGPSAGAILYKKDHRYPALISCAIFILNIALVMWVIPRKHTHTRTPKLQEIDNKHVPTGTENSKATKSLLTFVSTLRELLAVPSLWRVLCALGMISFLNRSMATSNIMGYYEKRFKCESYQLGFVSSVWAVFALIAQSFVVGPVATRVGERNAILGGLAFVALGNAVEGMVSTLTQYLIFSLPISVAASSVVGACVKSLVSVVVPKHHVGKTLGVVDILGSTMGIPAPLYANLLFGVTGVEGRAFASTCHYMCAVVLVGLLLPTHTHTKNDTHIHNSTEGDKVSQATEDDAPVKPAGEELGLRLGLGLGLPSFEDESEDSSVDDTHAYTQDGLRQRKVAHQQIND